MGDDMAALAPTWIKHPGVYIKREMDERGWLQRDLAFILGCPEQAVNMILSGKRGISADMAKSLGEAFDVSAEFFANLQQMYDLSQAKTPDPSVAVRRHMQTTYPVREMIKRGWLEQTDTSMLEMQLARFFDASAPSEIPYMALAAKKSTIYEERDVPPAQLAWLFRVRHIARSISVPRYSEKNLRQALGELEGLLLAPEEARHVPRILMECGVRLILVEKLPAPKAAKIDGVTFWLDSSSPVIGMTTRFDRINNFWFVLRHEIEHVLHKHGRDHEIIDSDLEGESATVTGVLEEERIANSAAADFCAPTDKLDSFMKRKHPFYYEKDVLALAKLLYRHPGLIIGQMQRSMHNYKYLARYLVKIRQYVLPGSIADGWGQVIPLSL